MKSKPLSVKVRIHLMEHFFGMASSVISGAFLLLLLFVVDKLEISISKSFLVIEWSKMILVYTIPLLALKTNIIYVNDIERREGVISLRRVLVVITTMVYFFCIQLECDQQSIVVSILLVSKLIDIFIEERCLLIATSGKVLEGYLFSFLGNILRLILVLVLVIYLQDQLLVVCLLCSLLILYSKQIRLRHIFLVNKSVITSLATVIVTTYMSAYMVNVIRVNLASFDPDLIDDFSVLLSLGGIFGIVYNVAWQRSYLKGKIVFSSLLKEIFLFTVILLLATVTLGPWALKKFFVMNIDDSTIVQILSILIVFSIGHVFLNLYKIRKKIVFELISYVIVSISAHILLFNSCSFMSVLASVSFILLVLGLISVIYEKSRLSIY